MSEPPQYTVPVAVGVLHTYGTPDKIRDLIARVKSANNVADAPVDDAPVLENLYLQLERAEAAAEALVAYGAGKIEGLRVEFDAKTKRAKIVRSGQKGRPPDYLKEFLANLAEATAERLEQETGKPAKSSQVRKEVARLYDVFFPPGYLDASPRGNIYDTWKNRERKRRKIVRQIDALAPSEEEVEQLIRRSGLLIAPGAWRSTPWIYLLEELHDLIKSEAAGEASAEP